MVEFVCLSTHYLRRTSRQVVRHRLHGRPYALHGLPYPPHRKRVLVLHRLVLRGGELEHQGKGDLQRKPHHSRDRIVVSTLRCGRSSPGSNPGANFTNITFLLFYTFTFLHFCMSTFLFYMPTFLHFYISGKVVHFKTTFPYVIQGKLHKFTQLH